jgi:hypothetical protein
MKGLKRALSLTMAAAMVFGLFTMTASADTNNSSTTATVNSKTKSESPITELPIYKVVKTNQGAILPTETFTIAIAQAGEDDLEDADGKTLTVNGIPIEVGPDFTTKTVSYTFDASCDTSTGTVKGEDVLINGTAQGVKSFDFTELNFTSTGIYRYYITESIPNPADTYITYDESKYQVDLYVYSYKVLDCNDTSEDHQHTDACYKNTYGVGHIVAAKVDSNGTVEEKPDNITFTNTVNVAELKVSKTVVGEEYTDDEAFKFHIMIPVGGDTITLEQDEKITAIIYDVTTVEDEVNGGTKEVKTKNSEVTIKVNGSKENDGSDGNDVVTVNAAYVKENGTEFTLKKDQVLEITAPQSMIFYVYEEDVTGEGYTQYYEYTESGDRNSVTLDNNTRGTKANAIENNAPRVIKGTVNSDGTTVAYTNSRVVTPDTGVSVDLIPYVLVAVIAACGAILLISAKKRRTNR